jgi:hypothetical protein
MEDEAGTKRRKGLFRRERTVDEFEMNRPLDELPPVDDSDFEAPEPIVSRPRSAKRTAEMFAPKENWSTDSWSDDAWDDAWKEPAVRRTSIPPAADPTPKQVDEWLESDAHSWQDVTRDSVRKLGGDPALATKAQPGATWDDTGEVDVGARDASVVTVDAPVPAADPELAGAFTRALTQPPISVTTPAPTETPAPQPGVSKRFTRERSSITPAAVAATPAATPTTAPASTDTGPGRDESKTDALIGQETRSKEQSKGPAASSTERIVDIADPVTSRNPNPNADPIDDSVSPSPKTVLPATSGASSTSDSVIATDATTDMPAPTAGSKTIIIGETVETAEDTTGATDTGAVAAISSGEDPDTPALTEEIEMDRDRAAAFVDRATWIGSGVALVAGARLLFHVVSSLRQANPAGGTLSWLDRFGDAFARAGATHGLLLIAAVALLSLPTLFTQDDLVPRRTGGGLGLVLGSSLLGVIGGLVALLVQGSIADAFDTVVSWGSRGDVLATLALSIIALGAAMRALRSYEY